MESSKLRRLVLLEIHLLCVFALSVQGNSSPKHENVIDLLAALNMSHHMSGVTQAAESRQCDLQITSQSSVPDSSS
ncbi:hypothetical protein CgunFtcFv8_013200 [Champsocephalus gunnari]|uniref:Uncharacterized protein n=1 Tax=Champsocephalus gunnari TaxID=52237 RepID=A0AAN8DYZ4_CHAGU|nr:hypothetical protein CgunFtcFv8_013200 [Champsocephalus gunnari]